MIYEVVDQRSPEWYEMRRGRITASRFSDILTSTGKPSTKQDGYINDLVAEHLAFEPLDYYQNDAMARGTELEPEARRKYEEYAQWAVAEVAFVADEALPIGCSPDGVVIDQDDFEPTKLENIIGGVELKCPGHRNHISWMRKGKCPPEYLPQIQGTMLICQVEWWDFFSYHPKIKKQFLFRVQRDENWIRAFTEEVQAFNDKLQKAIKEAERHGK